MALDFLAHAVLHAGDFVQTREGGCRLHPQLARAVVARCRVPQDTMEQYVRWLWERLSISP
jgi:hypothetical protein